MDLRGRTPDTMRLGQAIESADSELERCIIKEKNRCCNVTVRSESFLFASEKYAIQVHTSGNTTWVPTERDGTVHSKSLKMLGLIGWPGAWLRV